MTHPSFCELDGAPQGEELGLMKPLSKSSCSFFDNSFISDGANRYGARATGATPGIKSIWNSTGTDISKITRKQSKNEQAQTRESEEYKKSQRSKAETKPRKVKSQS
ncbi:hypothetical protein Tco_0967197 [Tanacetum coccineum]